jgi:hypothetical protein
MNFSKYIKNILDCLPSDHYRPANEKPVHFETEYTLFSMAAFLFMPFLICIILSLLIRIGILTPAYEIHLIEQAILFLLGIIGLCTLSVKLANRTISTSQYEWMLERYESLGLSRPNQNMSKQDLKIYVEKSYEIRNRLF